MKSSTVTPSAVKDFIIFQHSRNATNLYKTHLSIIRDIYEDHAIMLKKLENYAPSEVLENLNYLTKDKYSYIRKKTLDIGNEAIRDFEKNMEKVEISLKKE
tara:strand:- start:579 stop:881 length:303 start_codon:yes stop_codon:yes gene_type:complete